jgi:Right handed beta helix region
MKLFRILPVFILCVAVFAAPAKAAPEAGAVFKIHVSKEGNAKAGGTSETDAVNTLGAALTIYQEQCKGRPTLITVGPGVYSNEKVSPKKLDCPLTIEPAQRDKRPQFVGKGKDVWFALLVPGAKKVDVSITGMEVSDYQTAIAIGGDRSVPDSWIGGVHIAGNHFLRIGSLQPGVPPSTAAIRLVNSRQNVIENNHFETIRNLEVCGGLHAIYMAHMSSGNVIKNNRFVDGCGETIKVRDASNDNKVVDNTFERQEGSSLLFDGFCDKQVNKDCTKPEGECPSWDNVFESNTIVGKRPPSNRNITGASKIRSNLSKICPKPPREPVRILEAKTATR